MIFLTAHPNELYGLTWITALLRRRFGRLGIHFVSNLTAALLGPALLTTPVAAMCRPEGPPVSQQMVEDFLAKPTAFLSSDATSERDAAAMAIVVSQYVAANPAAMPALISALPQASADQRKAIGKGLFRVINLCAAVDQSVVRRTDNAVRKISDAIVVDAFNREEAAAGGLPGSRVAGDLKTASAGPRATQSLIGEVVTNGPASMRLSNPFVLPELR